jgi:predicted dehydrogenase
MLSALMRFDNNTVVQLDVNWLTPTKIREISVTGESGMFVVNYLTQELSFFENNLFQNGAPTGPIDSVIEGKMVRFKIEPQEPLRAELEHVIDGIECNRPPLVGAEDAYRALEIAEQIVTAGRQGESMSMVAPSALVRA